MPSVRVSLAIAGFSIALASCGVPSPDPALWQTDLGACPTIATVEQANPDHIFVMSSSLPDCRTGAMRFSTYRSNRGMTFAQAQLTGPEDEPARTHTTGGGT